MMRKSCWLLDRQSVLRHDIKIINHKREEIDSSETFKISAFKNDKSNHKLEEKFSICITDKGLIYRLYKAHLHLRNKIKLSKMGEKEFTKEWPIILLNNQ